MTTATHVEKAEELLDTAYQELEAARRTAEMVKARDLVEATRALFLAGNVPPGELPNTHRGTRFMLRRYGDAEMRLIYSEAYEDVHQDAYYDGLINFDTLSSRFSEIRGFIERIRGAGTK